MPDKMEETMLFLSKGIKWLVVFGTGCYLASAATVPATPQEAGHETITVEAGSAPAYNPHAYFPVFGMNEVMQMAAH